VPRIAFTRNLQRLVACPAAELPGRTVREVFDGYFAQHPLVRGYVLDEQGEVRKHVAVFVNGAQIADRRLLSDAIDDRAEIHVMQALSGG
jgi:hypothetical protein